jgi:hypothetical protein
MSGRVQVLSQPRWRSRWAGRVPKAITLLVVAILCAAGLRAAIAGPPSPPRDRPAIAGNDLSAQGFAEAFARAYLTWDAARPADHERQVAAFISEALDPGAGLSLPRRGAQTVLWTAAVQDRRVGGRGRLVTVAAETTESLLYLSVRVDRDPRGFMFIGRYPALVGPPATNTKAPLPDEPEVEDQRLAIVARRTVTNYLAREATNLQADLEPSAVVSLPPSRLVVRSIDAVQWTAARRVAVEVDARSSSGDWRLRYELDVVKRDRWYVRSIQANPAARRR